MQEAGAAVHETSERTHRPISAKMSDNVPKGEQRSLEAKLKSYEQYLLYKIEQDRSAQITGMLEDRVRLLPSEETYSPRALERLRDCNRAALRAIVEFDAVTGRQLTPLTGHPIIDAETGVPRGTADVAITIRPNADVAPQDIDTVRTSKEAYSPRALERLRDRNRAMLLAIAEFDLDSAREGHPTPLTGHPIIDAETGVPRGTADVAGGQAAITALARCGREVAVVDDDARSISSVTTVGADARSDSPALSAAIEREPAVPTPIEPTERDAPSATPVSTAASEEWRTPNERPAYQLMITKGKRRAAVTSRQETQRILEDEGADLREKRRLQTARSRSTPSPISSCLTSEPAPQAR